MKANPDVLQATRRALVCADGPLTRKRLIHEVVMRTRPHCWSESTWARRVREAIDVLISEGLPVVSDGTGFRVAKSRSEMELPLHLIEKQIRSLCVKLARAKGISFDQVVRQISLFEGAA